MYLAQANIARMKGPIDGPVMREFAEQLDTINSLADRHPGFVWRLQTEAGDATAIRVFEDELILFNMSVWKSLEDLFDYTYRREHAGVFRDRGKWFNAMDVPTHVLWWIPGQHVPTTEEAKQKLALLEEHGPTSQAFTFKHRFDQEGRKLEKESK